MSKNYFFISDVHLGLQDEQTEKLKEKKLVEFINFASLNCDELFILGDLFDYWFEYKRVVQKGYFKTFSALKEMTEKGIGIKYLIGNHDFMHRDFFEKEIGAELKEDAFSIVLNEKKFFLGHGDGLVKNDNGYKILKKILRNKTFQKMYSVIHPDLGIALASKTSKTSRDYTAEKDYGESDGLYEAACSKIDEGFDYVIFGHTHKRRNEKYKNGYYINLGSWLNNPCYGKFNGNNFEIIDW